MNLSLWGVLWWVGGQPTHLPEGLINPPGSYVSLRPLGEGGAGLGPEIRAGQPAPLGGGGSASDQAIAWLAGGPTPTPTGFRGFQCSLDATCLNIDGLGGVGCNQAPCVCAFYPLF
eukprot:EG_transcript_22063